MKVLDLRCAHGHGFEGWFASEVDFTEQNSRQLVECPLCGDHLIHRLPSAPRLNLSGAREVVPLAPPAAMAPEPSAEMQAAWLQTVHKVLKNTEDVGERFTEEARRIHYGEAPNRGIRGDATGKQRAALLEEGIEVVAIAIPVALKRPLQ